MCGIAGYFSKNLDNRKKIIQLMTDQLAYRGPDAEGIWNDNDVGINLGHRRLAIQDLSEKANQPMISSSGRYIIIFNGEIYNHKELRSKYNDEIGVVWKTESDTETLIEIIQKKGFKNVLNLIEGMFALAIWDKKLKKITLARDRMGEKPLYYGWQGEGAGSVFLFGSELNALKVHPFFNAKINKKAIQSLMTYSCIHAPDSIYKNIYKLEAGHFLELSIDNLTNKILPKSAPYWSLSEITNQGASNYFEHSFEDISTELEKLITDVVKKQMIGDVPVGSFLSGGVDSSLITSLMQKHSSRQIQTFTIGYKNEDFNEAKNAKKISDYLGTKHNELQVSENDAIFAATNMFSIYDEPFSDSSQIPTYLLSKLTSKSVKVALSGDGGDELFCGYNRYLLVSKWEKIIDNIPKPILKIIKKTLTSISTEKWDSIRRSVPFIKNQRLLGNKMHKLANIIDSKSIVDLYIRITSHWNCNELLENLSEEDDNSFKSNIISKFNLAKDLDETQKLMLVDGLTYLSDDIQVKLDRASMSNSLETRVPFLDHKLIEFVKKIPQKYMIKNNTGKFILRKILNKHVPKNLFERPKMGFGAPIETWLRGPLREWADSLINSKNLIEDGIFKPEIIRSRWNEHLSGKKNWEYHLWDVLMFQSWREQNK